MKRFTVFAALSAIALTAAAQNPAGMSEADMEKMMQGMQEMQTCMENLDQAAMERLRKEGEQMHAEVKALCAEGKRDEAQGRAMEYGKKVANDPTMKAMAECGKKMQGMAHPATAMPGEEDYSKRHVCDAQ